MLAMLEMCAPEMEIVGAANLPFETDGVESVTGSHIKGKRAAVPADADCLRIIGVFGASRGECLRTF
jgi:hypothetical protein